LSLKWAPPRALSWSYWKHEAVFTSNGIIVVEGWSCLRLDNLSLSSFATRRWGFVDSRRYSLITFDLSWLASWSCFLSSMYMFSITVKFSESLFFIDFTKLSNWIFMRDACFIFCLYCQRSSLSSVWRACHLSTIVLSSMNLTSDLFLLNVLTVKGFFFLNFFGLNLVIGNRKFTLHSWGFLGILSKLLTFFIWFIFHLLLALSISETSRIDCFRGDWCENFLLLLLWLVDSSAFFLSSACCWIILLNSPKFLTLWSAPSNFCSMCTFLIELIFCVSISLILDFIPGDFSYNICFKSNSIYWVFSYKICNSSIVN